MGTQADDFLFGGGVLGAFAREDPIGTSITGIIESAKTEQRTDIESGELQFWSGGDPMMQLKIIIADVDRRDMTDSNDDGRRALYVKGSTKPGSQSMHAALVEAIKAAGAKNLAIGGKLTFTFIGTEPSAKRGLNDRKLWQAQYVAPDPTAAAGEFLAPAQQAPAQAAPPAQPAQAAQQTGYTLAQIEAMKAAGIDVSALPVAAG
ncbi:MAG: hypothetical protein ACRDQA_05955 [Nocardioidaceae bacterium]